MQEERNKASLSLACLHGFKLPGHVPGLLSEGYAHNHSKRAAFLSQRCPEERTMELKRLGRKIWFSWSQEQQPLPSSQSTPSCPWDLRSSALPRGNLSLTLNSIHIVLIQSTSLCLCIYWGGLFDMGLTFLQFPSVGIASILSIILFPVPNIMSSN